MARLYGTKTPPLVKLNSPSTHPQQHNPMPFEIWSVVTEEPNTIQPIGTHPLSLAGTDGLLVRRMAADDVSPGDKIVLNAADIVELAGISSIPTSVIWRSPTADGTEAVHQVLAMVMQCGSDEADVIIHLLRMDATKQGYRDSGVESAEALRLVATPGTTPKRWRWAAPRMAIGGAIVGGKSGDTRNANA